MIEQHIDMLGNTYKDKITGFQGVASTVSFDLYGCVQVVLVPPVDGSEKKDGHWFDVNRLERVRKKRVMPVPEALLTAPAKKTRGSGREACRELLTTTDRPWTIF